MKETMSFSRKHIAFTFVSMFAAVALVSVLAWDSLRLLNNKNGFNRSFFLAPIKFLSVVAKPIEVTDFAGFQNNRIFFKTVDPAKLFEMNSDLEAKGRVVLNFPNLDKKEMIFSSFLDSTGIVTLAGNVPLIIEYDTQRNSTLYKFPQNLFTKAVKISEGNYIFRIFEKADQIFAKGNPLTGSLIKEVNISEKNKDGGISTDGMLHYDTKNNGVAYIYYHRNEFLYLDTNLNLVYKGHTIDTLKNSKIKMTELKGNLMTSSTPKRFSNATNTVADGFLYNYSRLMADNEAQEDFSQNANIDVYNLLNGKYVGSFRISNYKGEKLYKFRVSGNRLYALYQKHIASYELDFEVGDLKQ